MFKFEFYEDDSGPAEDDGSTDVSVQRLPLQEHTILGPPLSIDENELVALSLYGHDMKFLNGDLVTLRLEKEGLAGKLACASQGHTDLIPDVYEGGMKLWECSHDLVTFLAGGKSLAELHVLELGCGAALPSIFCLLRGAETVTVQDYNCEVVDHLTVPNLRLNVPERRLAECRAVSGDWAALADRLRADSSWRRADLVLSSETIYCPRSWPRLLDAVDAGLATDGTALVAAKTFYFGVGGGTRAFEQAVLGDGRFTSEVVFATKQGLHREILRLKRV